MTDAPKTIAEMREAAAKVADTLHYPDETKISASIRDAIHAIPLPDDAEMEEKVARALFAAEFYERRGGPVFVSPADERWEAWLPLARAALSAMRGEP